MARVVVCQDWTARGFLFVCGNQQNKTLQCFTPRNTAQEFTFLHTEQTANRSHGTMPTVMKTYTPEEIAERLDRHVNSIRRNLRKGQIEGQKFSGEWIVTEEALQEWLPPALYEKHFSNEEEA